jgi:ABC-type ATPase with predicted acetyltransferase domain
MSLFNNDISVEFDCEVERTKRVDLVFDVFGLNIEKYKHVVIDNLAIPYKWDILYITGVSGSGKSVLLRSIAENLNEKMLSYSKFTQRMKDTDKGIIELIGKDFEEAMFLLNTSGLSEAFIYFKKFVELSEGQRYRFYLAKLLESKSDVIIVDEFATSLDRITAKTVAYNYQKIVRRRNKKLIVATCHDDLIQELRPSHLISFTYSGEHEIRALKFDNSPRPPFIDEIETRKVSRSSKDMYILKYHYKNTHAPAMVLDILGYYYKDNIVGLMISNVPIRTYSLDRFYMTEGEREIWDTLTTGEKRLVSGNNTSNICREVVHPMFRGIGLASYMFERFIPQARKRLVIASAAMFNYVKFQESAGMRVIEPKSSSKYEKLSSFFTSSNIDVNRVYYDIKYRKEAIDEIRNDKVKLDKFLKLIELYTKTYFAGLGDRSIEENKRCLVSDEVLGKYLLKLRPTNVKTYYSVNRHVPIDFTSVHKFRSKLVHKKDLNKTNRKRLNCER